MPRALLIANPAAARTDPVIVPAVAAVLTRGGWQVELRATGGPGDARQFAAEAVTAGTDVVAVFGGDGTTMQAAAALVGTGTALGLIPGGTGNLLAGNLRLPNNPLRAAHAMLRARSVPLDLGRMERSDGTHYFAVAAGAGYDARVMAGTSAANKRRWRMGAYLATIVRLMPQLRSVTHRITVDGTTYTAQAAIVLVANCGEIMPPWIRLKSGIRPDDGELDVIVLRADSVTETIRAVWELLREGGSVAGQGPGFIGYSRGRSVTVESEPQEPVQLDGEAFGETPFTADVVPGALHVLVANQR